MYYIWTDESDTTGKYYANFYGGILINDRICTGTLCHETIQRKRN